MRRPNFKFSLPACLIAIFAVSLVAGAAGITLISTDQLKEQLTKPDVVVIDVRTGQDWESSQWKIKGAVRQVPAAAKEWMVKYPKDTKIVLYCACPQDATSTHVAEQLASEGFTNATVLKGGWNEWVMNQYPVEKK